MRLIGYWIKNLKDEDFCAPQEVVEPLPPDVRDRVARYLDGGFFHEGYLGYAHRRFFCDVDDEEMGSWELSDGYYVWPQGLSHYVRSHGVTLPDEFIEHVLHRPIHRRIKTLASALWHKVPWHESADPSLDFWREWCASRRSDAFVDRLKHARLEADKWAEEEVKELVNEEIERHGLWDQQCIFAGCSEKALRGKKVCARHALGDTVDITFACYSITLEIMDFLEGKTEPEPHE